MNRARNLLLLVIMLGAGVAAGGGGTYAKWAASEQTTGNRVGTGTIDVSVNSSTPMFAMGSAAPGAQPTQCRVVTNTGTAIARVFLYGQVSGTLVPYLTLRVTRGQKGGNCTSFGTATDVYATGPLGSFPTSTGTLDQGLWEPTESYPYRFELTLSDDPGAQGKTATIGMTWEGSP